MPKLTHYSWLRYGPVAFDDIRIMKLRELSPVAYIGFWDLILITKNSGGVLTIETKDLKDFERLFHDKKTEESFLELYESLHLIDVDRENFKVTLPEKFLNLVGSNSTERVRASRKRKYDAENNDAETDDNADKAEGMLHVTNEMLHETHVNLRESEQVFYGTDCESCVTSGSVDQKRSEKIRKDQGDKQLWQE